MRDKPIVTESPRASIHNVMTEVQRANGRLEWLDMRLEKIEKAVQKIRTDISAIRAQGEQ
jgi:predicted  nucleic acid-binding Zn-ribbon protein